MKKAAYIKNDLNLLPRKEGPSKFIRYGLPLIILITLLALALTAGIIIPKNMKAEKMKIAEDLSLKITDMASVQEEFSSLNLEITTLKSQMSEFEEFNSCDKTLYDILNTIEQNCPDVIKITTADFDYEKILLEGTCPSDAEVATFAVKLRSTGIFSEININTVEDEKEEDVVSVNRAFEMEIFYPVPEPEANGGAGK
jgi:hypothetical protein